MAESLGKKNPQKNEEEEKETDEEQPTKTVTEADSLNNNAEDPAPSSESTPPSSTSSPSSSDYHKLLALQLEPDVAERLNDIYKTGKLCHMDLDTRALDALKEFPVDGAIAVLNQFQESNLEHVTNKSAYLCGVMKTYRQKSRSINGGTSHQSHNDTSGSGLNGYAYKGPDENKIKAILERTGYTLDVTTGQRKFGGPPPNWDGPVPGNGCEVFCGKIPRDLYEDELIPLFEKCGRIWDLRLMMDPMTGLNRGYAFVTFVNKEGAHEAVKMLNDRELRKGKRIGVTISFNNHRLFVGNIPKNWDRERLNEVFSKHTPNLREVIIYSSPDDKKKNRGFCFLEYESHKAASSAKRRLETGRIKVWSCDIIVDWADPQEEPSEDTMSKVKVLYVRNLTIYVTEEMLREVFEGHGGVNRVKKIKDYAFVHFEEREHAIKAMEALNGAMLEGAKLEISLAKPPFDKKKKEEMLRRREQRMMKSMAGVSFPPFPAFSPPYAIMTPGMYGFGQGGSWGGRGTNQNVSRGGVRGNPGMSRGFYDNSGWHWGGWGDASWQPRGGPPMSPWMGPSVPPNESWNHTGVRGGYHPPPNNASYVSPSGIHGVNGSIAGSTRGRQQQRAGGYTR